MTPPPPPPKNKLAAPAPLSNRQVALNFGLVGASCTVAQGTVHWTQTTMVRQQLASASAGAEPSFVACVSGIYANEGVTGLYRGFSAAAFREMTYSSLRFGLYEPIKIAIGANGKESAPWQNVTAGLLAGTVAAGVASPTDLLTARMMKPGESLGMVGTARAVVAESGLRVRAAAPPTPTPRRPAAPSTLEGCPAGPPLN